MNTLIFLKDLPLHIWASKVGVSLFFLIAKGYYGKMPSPLRKHRLTFCLYMLFHTETLSTEKKQKKEMLKLVLVAAPIQEDLKELRNTNCPPRDKFAFSIFDLSNPNLKKKKSMRAREEKGGRKMSPLKIPLESQLKSININTRHLYIGDSWAGSREPCCAWFFLNVRNKTHTSE